MYKGGFLRREKFSIFRTLLSRLDLCLMFLRVEKIGKRTMKEVDAKHLLFLCGEWAAKQLGVWV